MTVAALAIVEHLNVVEQIGLRLATGRIDSLSHGVQSGRGGRRVQLLLERGSAEVRRSLQRTVEARRRRLRHKAPQRQNSHQKERIPTRLVKDFIASVRDAAMRRLAQDASELVTHETEFVVLRGGKLDVTFRLRGNPSGDMLVFDLRRVNLPVLEVAGHGWLCDDDFGGRNGSAVGVSTWSRDERLNDTMWIRYRFQLPTNEPALLPMYAPRAIQRDFVETGQGVPFRGASLVLETGATWSSVGAWGANDTFLAGSLWPASAETSWIGRATTLMASQELLGVATPYQLHLLTECFSQFDAYMSEIVSSPTALRIGAVVRSGNDTWTSTSIPSGLWSLEVQRLPSPGIRWNGTRNLAARIGHLVWGGACQAKGERGQALQAALGGVLSILLLRSTGMVDEAEAAIERIRDRRGKVSFSRSRRAQKDTVRLMQAMLEVDLATLDQALIKVTSWSWGKVRGANEVLDTLKREGVPITGR